MKKRIAFIAALLMLLSTVGFSIAMAQTSEESRENRSTINSNESVNQNTARSKETSRTRTASRRSVTGTVTSVASDGNSFVLQVGNRNVTVNRAAQMNLTNRSGGKINFQDVRVGDRLTAFGTVTRTNSAGSTTSLTATTVRVSSR